MSYGLVALHRRAERETALAQLERNLEGTVQALSRSLEMRDPYTAGHQRRVATLAVAIGRKLGLDVPAELLSKPGRLVPAEFELIRGHALTGHDVVKGIEFPWPLADMIVQHHERLDGSGYPYGLTDKQLLLESKLLAIADVVEAIAAHRPCCPSRGIGAALEYIESGKGKLFDPAAVDACLQLFREQGFQFDSEPTQAAM